MSRIHQIAALGQSIWLDYIRRSFLTSGGMQAAIDNGVTGVTSNPTIFDKAIANSDDYDADLARLAAEGRTVEEIYQALTVADIRLAADLLRPVYDRTEAADGHVSLEVSPKLAYDTAGTVAEAQRLFVLVDRPNVMIKVPATADGIPAFEALIAAGLNVNATLMFSLGHYEAVANAYITGLERLAARGGDLRRVASVASFFVSRVDTLVDQMLESLPASCHAACPGGQARERSEASLLGQIAVANSKLTYVRFKQLFAGERWERLAAQGARVQRPLWASTSTKNPNYLDTIYVDNLIGPHTVNTLPQATYEAVLDHGLVALTLESGLDESRAHLDRLAELGIDLDAVTAKLQTDGVAAFAHSFDSLLASIASKRAAIKPQRTQSTQRGAAPGTLIQNHADPPPHVDPLLGTREGTRSKITILPVLADRSGSAAKDQNRQHALEEIARGEVIPRIWAGDHTVWKPDPAGIADRLGWLRCPATMPAELPRLQAFAGSVRDAGYTHALLLGMGGSSLAPELFGTLFSVSGGLSLAVLDSTVPGAVLAHARRLDPARTLFIVSTKSGTTVETLSFFKYFYNWAAAALGTDHAGDHFVAITDPGSKLAGLAARLHFRDTFLNDPTIGGRNSALSFFGLVPAALVGVDLTRLLDRAAAMAAACDPAVPVEDNPAACLGVSMAESAKASRDKLTFIAPPHLAGFCDWAEQLVAESTGKEGKGILPIVGEPLGPPEVYGDDRLFVYLGDRSGDPTTQIPTTVWSPSVQVDWPDLYDLGGQFFLWELATAVAGHRLGINPFDQPNVEAAKVLARRLVAEYADKGTLPVGAAASLDSDALACFLDQAQRGDYVAVQAYLQPTVETTAALQAFRARLRDRTRLAVTLGYGPRYLHSTGQLHKGDAGHGLFIQLTAPNSQDAPIPDEPGSPASSLTFGLLKTTQVLGDAQALAAAGRRVIHFDLGEDTSGGLAHLA